MPPKSPFVKYTPEQILAYEAVTYVIVAGSDFFDVDGNFFFTKTGAERYYDKLIKQLSVDLKSGTRKERSHARRVLENLRVERMRIH